MRTNRVLTVCGLLTAALGLASPVVAQGRASDRASEAKALSCVFSTMVSGSWNSDGAVAETMPAKLSIAFADVDADEGTARVIGEFGPSDVVVRLSLGTLHVLQAFGDGPLYATTVFPWENRPGFLRAAHMRHVLTADSRPGVTSRPEQYYGECEVTK